MIFVIIVFKTNANVNLTKLSPSGSISKWYKSNKNTVPHYNRDSWYSLWHWYTSFDHRFECKQLDPYSSRVIVALRWLWRKLGNLGLLNVVQFGSEVAFYQFKSNTLQRIQFKCFSTRLLNYRLLLLSIFIYSSSVLDSYDGVCDKLSLRSFCESWADVKPPPTSVSLINDLFWWG